MGRWGIGNWGQTGWGGPGLNEGLELVAAEPVAENVVRLRFNRAPHFTGLLDPDDGSDIGKYAVTADESSAGEDALPPRRVLPARVTPAFQAGAQGTLIDLFVDRSFSPYPSRYLVAVSGLRAQDGTPLVPGRTSVPFDGLAPAPRPQLKELAAQRGDLANAQIAGLGENEMGAVLGSYPVDSRGDYGIDQGLSSYKKRILRRLISTQGAFAHLSSSRYGVGVLGIIKQLGRAGSRERLAAEAEAQIKLEPETRAVSVQAISDPSRPGIVVLAVRAKTTAGDTVAMNVPFRAG